VTGGALEILRELRSIALTASLAAEFKVGLAQNHRDRGNSFAGQTTTLVGLLRWMSLRDIAFSKFRLSPIVWSVI
jgi:hypothetical protein